MSCGEECLQARLADHGYPLGDPWEAASGLGLRIVLDRGPAEFGGLRVVAAIDRGVIRVYERAIERLSEEGGEDPSHLRRLAVAHEVIHEVARRNRMEPIEPTVHRLALQWVEARRGRHGGRFAPLHPPPGDEHWGDSPRE